MIIEETILPTAAEEMRAAAGILEAAADAIEHGGGWCQGAWAKDANGESCDPWDDGAKSRCMIGWVRAIGIVRTSVLDINGIGHEHNRWLPGFSAAYELLCERAKGDVAQSTAAIDWNDDSGRTPEQVIERLRNMAALARITAMEIGEPQREVQVEPVIPATEPTRREVDAPERTHDEPAPERERETEPAFA